jgi:hypothetical protein
VGVVEGCIGVLESVWGRDKLEIVAGGLGGVIYESGRDCDEVGSGCKEVGFVSWGLNE